MDTRFIVALLPTINLLIYLSIRLWSALKSKERHSYDSPLSQDPWSPSVKEEVEHLVKHITYIHMGSNRGYFICRYDVTIVVLSLLSPTR